MKLDTLKIKGFRRHFDSEFKLSDATFLIGANNVGKSSVFKALDYLLNDKKKMNEMDFYHILNRQNENERLVSEIQITGVFRDVPFEAKDWQGFNKQRLLKYKAEDKNETGLQIVYRKTFTINGQCKIEMKQLKMTVKEQFKDCKTINDYIVAGLNKQTVDILFEGKPLNTRITDKVLLELQDLSMSGIDELFDINNKEEIWFENPGGIAGNVISRLPKFLLIPDLADTNELSGKNGALIDTLNSLFEDVRNSSENFTKAQHYLNLLAKELDPSDENSDFHLLLKDLNKVVSQVFPETAFYAQANLSDASQVIVPRFDVSLGSNINTDVINQGAGVIRSAIFALLRYRSIRENKKKIKTNEYVRPLIIGFEEPEIYLHPKAAQQMRDTIYELALDKNNQIVATTHSPYMIDLSKKSSQILNSLSIKGGITEINNTKTKIQQVFVNPFNVTKAFKELSDEHKDFLKMLIKIDDNIAKVFFAKNVLIVEGDTEEVVMKESIARIPELIRNEIIYDWEIVKARGKATIISLVKYLKALGINPWVIHDMDSKTPKAMLFNEPILRAIGDEKKRIMLEDCIEDVLGYNAPSKEKPFKAYSFIKDNWTEDWDSINLKWRKILEQVFKLEKIYLNKIQAEAASTKE